MHKRLRIAFSRRIELLQVDIDACDATIRHLDACKECTDDVFCPAGAKLYDKFLIAQSRAKLLAGDTDVAV